MSEVMQTESIFNTWLKATTSPNEETYQQIANDPSATMGRSALWIFVGGTLGSLIAGIVGIIRAAVFGPTNMDFFGEYGELFQDFSMPRPTIMGTILSSPLGGIGALIAALIGVGLIYLVARALGGTGSYENLFNTMAAYYVPLSLLTAVLSAIPMINCISPLVGIYMLVLGVIANKVVMGYDYGKAAISSVAVPVVIFSILFICAFLIFGAAIASVFQGITDGLNMMPQIFI